MTDEQKRLISYADTVDAIAKRCEGVLSEAIHGHLLDLGIYLRKEVKLAAGASEGREAVAIYQYTEYPKDGLWRDCSESEYDRTNPKWRRIVYAAPIAPSADSRDAEIAALRERIAGMEKDAERLAWFSRNVTVDMLNSYTRHVLSRGGDGDLSDIRTFLDAAIAAQRCADGKEKQG